MAQKRGLPMLLAAAVLLMVPASLSNAPWNKPAQAANCAFVLGFNTLRDMIPDMVGDCLVDEHHNPANGDGLQETSGVAGRGGLMVWRKADNWTAYTDGYRTWINGPFGLQSRLNPERFSWEAAGDAPPAAPPAPAPAPSASPTTAPTAAVPQPAGPQPTASAPVPTPFPTPGGPRGTVPLPPPR
ncbi:MAG: hypothetical protein NTZ05_23195 [Chloroflexi bacterium]|nr:hypothetical protein [Chloroflexota bacterium]